jgi:hypothetical protein
MGDFNASSPKKKSYGIERDCRAKRNDRRPTHPAAPVMIATLSCKRPGRPTVPISNPYHGREGGSAEERGMRCYARQREGAFRGSYRLNYSKHNVISPRCKRRWTADGTDCGAECQHALFEQGAGRSRRADIMMQCRIQRGSAETSVRPGSRYCVPPRVGKRSSQRSAPRYVPQRQAIVASLTDKL